MSSTKKLLVAFDPAMPDAHTSDFLIPWNRDGRRVLRGLKSGKDAAFGMMVFVGRSITENDLFAKLVDSGAVIEDVDETLALLRSYLEALQTLKIGNVTRMCSATQNSGDAIELELVANAPSATKKWL
jgi:hypothetical protein